MLAVKAPSAEYDVDAGERGRLPLVAEAGQAGCGDDHAAHSDVHRIRVLWGFSLCEPGVVSRDGQNHSQEVSKVRIRLDLGVGAQRLPRCRRAALADVR